MKKLSIFNLLLILFLSQLKISAQEVTSPEPEKRLKHSIGLGVGFTTGYGLSYRYMGNKFGAQLNFAPYKGNNRGIINKYYYESYDKDHSISKYSIGLTFFYSLLESEKTTVFLYQGNHYFYKAEKFTGYDWNSSTYVPYTLLTEYFNNGIGIGIEFINSQKFSLNLMIGYASFRDFEVLSITAETGLYYKF